MSSRPPRGAARLAAILDALPDALVLVNANGTVVNANAIALEAFEAPGTALVGRGLLDLLPQFDSKLIPGSMRRPDHMDPRGRTKPTRMTARRTDGTEFPVEVTSANLESGQQAYDGYGYTGDELLMLVVRDLSGTVDTEAELARSQRQTEMILRAAGEGVVGTDTDGRIVLVNPAAAQILGYRASDLGGKQLHDLFLHSRADGSPFPYDESPLADTLRSGRKHRVRGQVLWSKSGDKVPVDLTTAPVRDGDQLVGAVMTFLDRRPYDALVEEKEAAEQRHAEELERLAESHASDLTALRQQHVTELEELRERHAEELAAGEERYAALAEREKDRYEALAGRYEQLLTLLGTSLRGPLDELRRELSALAADDAGQLWPEANQVLHHLSAGYSRITTLIDNVLGYQRLDSGGGGITRTKVMLDAVVATGVDGAVELIGPGRVQFAVHAPPIEAEVDAALLATALAHLVADVAGVDATGNSPVSAGGYLDNTVVVAAAQRGEVVRIEVRGPYSGGDPVHEPIVRGIVRAHGGVLQTHEVPGMSGSAYVLEVPLGGGAGAVSAPAPAPEDDAVPAAERTSGGGRRRARRASTDAFLDADLPGTADGAAEAGPERPAPAPTGRRRRRAAAGEAEPPAPAELPAAESPEPGSGTGRRRGRAAEDAARAAAGVAEGAVVTADEHAAGTAAAGTGLGGTVPPQGVPAPGGRRARRGPEEQHALPPALPAAAEEDIQPTGRRRRALAAAQERAAAQEAGPRTVFALPPADADRAPDGPEQESRQDRPGPPVAPVPPVPPGQPVPPVPPGRQGLPGQVPPASGSPGEQGGQAPRSVPGPAGPQTSGAPGDPAAQPVPGPRPLTGGPGRPVPAPSPHQVPRQSAPGGAPGTPGTPGSMTPPGVTPVSGAPAAPGADDHGRHDAVPHDQADDHTPPQPHPVNGPTGRRRRAVAVPPEPAGTPGTPAQEIPARSDAARTGQAGAPHGAPEPPPGRPLPAAQGQAVPAGPANTASGTGHVTVPPQAVSGTGHVTVPPQAAPGTGHVAVPAQVTTAQPVAHSVAVPAVQPVAHPLPGQPLPAESVAGPGTPAAGTPAPRPWPAADGNTPGAGTAVPAPGAHPAAAPAQGSVPQAPHRTPPAVPLPPEATSPAARVAQPLPAETAPVDPDSTQGRAISVRTLGQGVPFNRQAAQAQQPPAATPAPHQHSTATPAPHQPGGSGRRRKLGTPPEPAAGRPHPAAEQPAPQPVPPVPPVQPPRLSAQASEGAGRSYAIGAPDENAAEGPEPLDGPGGAVEVADTPRPQPMDDELPPEPLDNPRRLLVWPAPDVSTQQALSDRGYRPVIVHSREEVDAQIAAFPAALFVDPLTGPITRTALQSLRQAAVAAEVPVMVTAGLGQASRDAAYGADPAVLLKALAPRDSEQHPPRVLLIEEHAEIALALTATLERRGMQVARAASDTDAVTLAGQFRPNLVVMDLMQVHRRRAGIVDWLRANGQLNRTPLVVYTAAVDQADLPRLASGETVLFLAERSTSAEVQARIVDLLARIGTN
ncbi:PAS domain-containing protein [Streptomyces glaucescens]|uniref:PAS domain-containing protein n=1 Tax=Streptomyces glaucescens TaxID=1907 RepID=UPI00344FE2DA